MSIIKSLRGHLFVDYKLQTALVNRVMTYWLVCLATLALMIFAWRIVTGPSGMFYAHFEELWRQFGPAAIASLFLLPLVAFDIVRLSNSFVGPLLRLRRAMRALAHGEEVAPLTFREGDFWQEFAAEFNAVAQRLQKLNKSVSADSSEGDERDQQLLAETLH